jgi:hypothetical protein
MELDAVGLLCRPSGQARKRRTNDIGSSLFVRSPFARLTRRQAVRVERGS